MIHLSHSTQEILGEIQITGSKSESNRWLILNEVFNRNLIIQNLSNAKDTQVLQKALNSKISENQQVINIGHAGTAMRFLTAFFAIENKRNVLLTGSERMQERPIHPLVDALNRLGCDIKYNQNSGFPPLEILGKNITKKEVSILANVSSQYITALMLIGPKLPVGLKINFIGQLTSRPYIEMTKRQLESIGVEVNWLENGIEVKPFQLTENKTVTVESDWSSASYWFSMVALSNDANIKISSFQQNSLQGDAAVAEIYLQYFGVETEFNQDQLILKKIKDFIFPEFISLDLNHTPDIAQTIAVTCAGLQIKAKLTGLKTLKVKETDRLLALKNELAKCGTEIKITDDSLEIISFNPAQATPTIQTYQDHRMAMAFAPLALKFPIQIEEEEVVKKSYPDFWYDLEAVGFRIR